MDHTPIRVLLAKVGLDGHDRGVKVVATFPAGLTEPIAYPFAVTRAGDGPAARRFMAFLATPAAQEAFARRGFITE